MREIDNCYFCTTPFQVSTSINLALHDEGTSDLYLSDQFAHAEEYAERIRSFGIFKQVKVLIQDEIYEHSRSGNYIQKRIGIVKSYFNVDRISKKILIADTQYKKIYISSRAYLSRLVILHFIKHNMNVEVVYFDDGEGSYDNIYTYKPRFSDSVVRFLIFGPKSLEGEHVKYLYRPDLYFILHPESTEDIRKIPDIEIGEEVSEYLKKLFNITPDKLINKKVIILDTIHTDMPYKESKKLNDCYQKIIDFYGKDNVIIKKHPRDTDMSLLNCEYYTDNSIPFEALCMNMDMREKVLVAVFSTALVLPKLLLDQEPGVIVLCNILSEFSGNISSQLEFYNKVKGLYKDSDKFTIPENEEVLLKSLQ